jgi:hypothetical protein
MRLNSKWISQTNSFRSVLAACTNFTYRTQAVVARGNLGLLFGNVSPHSPSLHVFNEVIFHCQEAPPHPDAHLSTRSYWYLWWSNWTSPVGAFRGDGNRESQSKHDQSNATFSDHHRWLLYCFMEQIEQEFKRSASQKWFDYVAINGWRESLARLSHHRITPYQNGIDTANKLSVFHDVMKVI